MSNYRLERPDEWARVKKALKQVPDKVLKKVLRKSLKNSAERVAVRAKANCPVQTGKLKNSIEVVPGKQSKGLVGYDVGAGSREKGGAWYAALVESGYLMAARGKGTKLQRGSLKGKTRKIRQVPGVEYLGRALEAEAEQTLKEVHEDLIEAFSE